MITKLRGVNYMLKYQLRVSMELFTETGVKENREFFIDADTYELLEDRIDDALDSLDAVIQIETGYQDDAKAKVDAEAKADEIIKEINKDK